MMQVEPFLTDQLRKQYVEQQAIFFLDKGERWATCPLCTMGYVMLQPADVPPGALFYCHNSGCKRVTCELCKREVTAASEKLHTEGCWSVAMLYQDLQQTIAECMTRKCPGCGVAGMKV